MMQKGMKKQSGKFESHNRAYAYSIRTEIETLQSIFGSDDIH